MEISPSIDNVMVNTLEMDKIQNLTELEKLYSQYRDIKQFDSKDSLISWASKVVPLLKFNVSYYAYFAERFDCICGDRINHTDKSALDIMSAQIQTAIEDLKNQINSPDETIITTASLSYPEKITLKWLWIHVPWRFWVSLILLIFAIFSLGIRFSNTKLYKSLISPAIPSIKQKKDNDMKDKSPIINKKSTITNRSS